MVIAVKEQQPKKSKLSLFRLGKSSSKSSTSSIPQVVNSFYPQTVPRAYAASSYTSNTYPSAHSTPRQYHKDGTSSSTNRIVNDARQAANNPIAVHYQFPDGTNVPRNYHHASSSEHQHRYNDQVESQNPRIRSDSLPLQAFVHPSEHASAAARPPALECIRTDLTHKHTRQRSHFSIPDVIVTTCEEGQEQNILVEVEIPPNKRRSYMLRDTSEESLRERSYKKSNPGYTRSRPAPLIRFDTDEIKGIGSAMMPRSASLGSVTSVSSGGAGSPTDSATTTASSASSAGSSKASSVAKRSRKPSFPLLFGRKASNAAFELENSPTTPTSAPPAGYGDSYVQPDGLIFTSHTSHTSHTSSRNIFARAIGSSSSSSSGLPTPPVTPTSPPKASRKQMKAKAKEELALIKELERVDRLVKQHDDRARRVREKEAERERKRAQKLAPMNGKESVDMGGSTSGRGKTVFKAASAGAVGVGRRTSIRAAGAVVGERRGSEPTLTRCISPPAEARVSTPFSIDLSDAERLPFTQPRAAPLPNVAASTAPLVLTKQTFEGRPSLSRETTSPPRPTRPAPPVPEPHNDQAKPESNDTTLTEDADETTGWNCRQSFSEFSSGLNGPLPSLINSAVLAPEVEEHEAKLARRASVQRILALSEAEGARSHKRASMVKRRSCTADEGSNRSSAASMRRKSFIRTVADDEGWTVDGGPDAEDDGEWEEEQQHQQQPVEVEVDAVLADLRAAQDAGRLKLDGDRTPTPQTYQDKENIPAQPMLGKMQDEANFRLSLALTPLQLQPLITDLDRF